MSALTVQGVAEELHTVIGVRLHGREARVLMGEVGLTGKFSSAEAGAGRTTIYWKETPSPVELSRLESKIAELKE